LKCTPLRNRIFHLTFPSMCLLCVRALCPWSSWYLFYFCDIR
jgi:hypothetical protein